MLTTATAARPIVSLYSLTAGSACGNGRHIRMATLVTMPDGTEVHFLDRVPSKREAITTATRWIEQGLVRG